MRDGKLFVRWAAKVVFFGGLPFVTAWIIVSVIARGIWRAGRDICTDLRWEFHSLPRNCREMIEL